MEKEKRKRVIKRENCLLTIRATASDILNRKMTLSGRYAFEWKVSIETDEYVITTTFKNRKEALTFFNKKKKKH